MKTAPAALLIVVLALGGCANIRSTRERIVKTPPRCPDETVQIYFEPGEAELTREGRRVILEAAERARGCVVEKVSVLGLADPAGDPRADAELASLRAQSVARALTAARLPAAEFEVGAADAQAVAPDGAAAPLRRGAHVRLRLARPD